MSQAFQLTLSRNLKEKIAFHCKEHPTVEWSGPLFYRVIEGDTTDIPNLKIEAFDFFLMDVGTSGYTEYDMTKELMTYMVKKNLDLGVNCFIGHIHSHQNMSVFFSPTDEDELCINAPQHNAYLSLIVNNRAEFQAKLAQVIETPKYERSFVIPTFSGEKKEHKEETDSAEIVVSYPAKITVRESDHADTIKFTVYKDVDPDSEEKVELSTELMELIAMELTEDLHDFNTLKKEWKARSEEVVEAKKPKVPVVKRPPYKAYNQNHIVFPSHGADAWDEHDFDFDADEPLTIRDFSKNSSKKKPITERNLDGTVGFERDEVETFLKKCMRVSERTPITLHEFLKHCENTKGEIDLDNVIVDNLKDRFIRTYHELFPEDQVFEHLEELIDESISIVDNFYRDGFPKVFPLLVKGVDEMQTLWANLNEEEEEEEKFNINMIGHE